MDSSCRYYNLCNLLNIPPKCSVPSERTNLLHSNTHYQPNIPRNLQCKSLIGNIQTPNSANLTHETTNVSGRSPPVGAMGNSDSWKLANKRSPAKHVLKPVNFPDTNMYPDNPPKEANTYRNRQTIRHLNISQNAKQLPVRKPSSPEQTIPLDVPELAAKQTIPPAPKPSAPQKTIPPDSKPQENDENKRQKLSCRICGSIYRYRAGLYKHMKAKHPKETPNKGTISCQEDGCTFRCRYLSELRDHLTFCHSLPSESENLTFQSQEGK